MSACHEIFVPAEAGQGFLYVMCCPECGGDAVQMEQVRVAQKGIATIIERSGDRLEEDDSSDLPGALISLACQCAAGHSFVIGILQGEGGVRVYSARIPASDQRDSLWINKHDS
jgi:hypothetical protein